MATVDSKSTTNTLSTRIVILLGPKACTKASKRDPLRSNVIRPLIKQWSRAERAGASRAIRAAIVEGTSVSEIVRELRTYGQRDRQ